jgi:hypothetical protein
MVQNRVLVGRVLTGFTEVSDRGPVGTRADEYLVDVFSLDFRVRTETECHFLVKRVDEEVKKLVLVDFTVCLVVFGQPQQADFSTNGLCEVLNFSSSLRS